MWCLPQKILRCTPNQPIENIQILDGLAEGDEVVTSSYMGMNMEEGMAVTVMPDPSAIPETATAETTTAAE